MILLREKILIIKVQERYVANGEASACKSFILYCAIISLFQVYNGECNNSPDVIVVAGDVADVAKIVKFVRDSSDKIDLSVRSGGHSYGCTSSRVSETQ